MKIFSDPMFDNLCGEGVCYGFFGRTGGVSGGLYDSLNCGPGTQDDPASVMENRRRVASRLGSADGAVSTLWQCHSPDCLTIDRHVTPGEARPRGDALVTDASGLAIGCLTADCGPVLFLGRKADGAPVVGAAHAGWGGALGGVLESTITAMEAKGAPREGIVCALGPCIGAASYEVSDDFMRPFVIRHEEAERFFRTGRREGHMMFDLEGYICFRLALAGVGTVRTIGVDTYANEAECFSYRRATHRQEPDYGRQISAIMIRAAA